MEEEPKRGPKITLNELEKTVVHVPTWEEFTTLMRVYTYGWWRHRDGDLPIDLLIMDPPLWDEYKEETCIPVKDGFGHSDRKYYLGEGYDLITMKEFYDEERITQEKIDEINQVFEAKE